MKNATELIALLDANAPNYESVALVVGYENGDGFVLANDPNRLPVLEDSLKRKGTPAGLVGLKRLPNGRLIAASLIEDLGANTPDYMQYVMAAFSTKYQEEPNRTKSYFMPTPAAK